MKDQLKIGVVIVNYNSLQYLLKALEALDGQSYKPAEVIVFDNASSEELPEIQTNFKLTIIKSSINLGFAAGSNRGVENLTQDISWVALLNPDAYPRFDWLEEMAKAIELYPEYAFFGSKLISADKPELLDGMGDAYHISGKAWRIHHQKPVKDFSDNLQEIFSPCAAAALYKRDVYNEVQGFDEDFFCYYEDIDLAFRLRLLGFRCCYIPTAVVFHVGSVSTKRHSDFYTYHGHRNLVWTYLKNMPLPLLLLGLPLHMALTFLSLIIFTYRRQAKVIFKAKFDALKAFKRVRLQRKSLQQRRVISTKYLLSIIHKGLPR